MAKKALGSVNRPAPPQMGPTSADDAAAMLAADLMLGGGNPSPTTPPGTDLYKAESMAGPEGQDKANGGQMSELSKKEDESDDEYEERMEKMKKAAAMQKSEGGAPGLQDIIAAAQAQQVADRTAAPAPAAAAPVAAQAAAAAVTVADDELLKSFGTVMDVARGGSVDVSVDRRAELADILHKGEMTAEQNAELQALLKSELVSDDIDDDDDDLTKSDTFAEAVLADVDIQAGHVGANEDGSPFDVSGFLARQAAFVGGALDSIKGDLGEQLTKSFGQLNEYNLAMARASRALAGRVVQQGQIIAEQNEMLKSMTGRISTVENAPQPRRGVPSAQALNKSMGSAGESAGPTGDMQRGDVVRGLITLQQNSQDGKAPCGQEITVATAHYETTGEIHPSMMADVRKALS